MTMKWSAVSNAHAVSSAQAVSTGRVCGAQRGCVQIRSSACTHTPPNCFDVLDAAGRATTRRGRLRPPEENADRHRTSGSRWRRPLGGAEAQAQEQESEEQIPPSRCTRKRSNTSDVIRDEEVSQESPTPLMPIPMQPTRASPRILDPCVRICFA